MAGNDIYEYASMQDDGCININRVGPLGLTSFWRNTIIGNGRGAAVLTVYGQTAQAQIDGQLVVSRGENDGSIILKSTLSRTVSAFAPSIIFVDNTNFKCGYVGYISS